MRRTGTPFGQQETNLGGNIMLDSAPWGYMRADNVDAVLYIDDNRHVHEIRRSGPSFVNTDFTAAPIGAPIAHGGQQNGPVPDAIGYIRSGGRSAVIYRDTSDHVVELLHNPGGNPLWTVNDLTVLSGTPLVVGKGTPFPYARSDGYNVIVYTANDSHIHELYTFGTPGSGTGPWTDGDLSIASGAVGIAGEASSDPWGYVRSDNLNTVLYIGQDGKLHELALLGTGWSHWTMSTAVSPLTGLFRRASGYVRGDGLTTVVYVGFDDAIHELALFSTGWSDAVLPTPGVIQVSQLFAHRPTQDRGSIMFSGMSNGFRRGFELRLPQTTGWVMNSF